MMDSYPNVDRKKEMILVSGLNVYPNEVENVIASCRSLGSRSDRDCLTQNLLKKVVAYVVTKDKNHLQTNG